MPFYHLFLAILVAAIWGVNFIFIKLGLKEISPLLLCAVRFLLASVPAIFFIKRPTAPFKMILAYGLLMFGVQFLFLFMGMHVGVTPGLASLLMQTQVFFSIFFAAILLGEMPGIWQMMGACVSFTGIGLVAVHSGNTVSLWGFILIIASAASWGLGNLVTKHLKNENMIALVVWGSFVACLPMLLCSFIFEGTASMAYSFHHLSWVGISSIAYIVCISTWLGYGIWNSLLSRYPVAAVVPFTLLVPLFAMLSSMLIFDEPLQPWKLLAGCLVIAGLGINLLGTRLFARKHVEIEMIKAES